MPDDFTRAEGVAYRELLPGHLAFDCPSLRASLAPAACADHWRACRYAACGGCSIGAAHAWRPDTTSPPRQGRNLEKFIPCLRCGGHGRRLIGRIFCVSCWNRARETVVGKNSKGTVPTKWPALLREANADVRIPNASSVLHSLFYHRRPRGSSLRALQQSARLHAKAIGLPSWKVVDEDLLNVLAIVTGIDELRAIVERLMPGAKVVSVDIGPTFAARWADE